MVKFSHQFHGTTPSGWLIKVLKLSAESFNTLIRKWCVCVFMDYLIMWGTILSIIPPNIQWCSMTFYLFIKLLISDSGPTNPQVRTSISISLGGLAAGSKSLCQVPPIQGPWIPSCVSKWAWVHFSKLCLIQRKFSIIQGMIVYVYLTRGPVSKVTQMIVEEGPRSWIRVQEAGICAGGMWKTTRGTCGQCPVNCQQCQKEQFGCSIQLVCHQPDERPMFARQVSGNGWDDQFSSALCPHPRLRGFWVWWPSSGDMGISWVKPNVCFWTTKIFKH